MSSMYSSWSCNNIGVSGIGEKPGGKPWIIFSLGELAFLTKVQKNYILTQFEKKSEDRARHANILILEHAFFLPRKINLS